MGRFGIKIVGMMLLISICAFVISLVLVDDMLQVSTATMKGHTQELEADLREVMAVYREHVETKKKLYDLRAKVMAEEPSVTAAVWGRDAVAVRRAISGIMTVQMEALFLAVYDEAEQLVAEAGMVGEEGEQYRVVLPIGSTGWRLVAGFPINIPLQERFEFLGRKLEVEAPHLKRINRALQPHYFPAFVRYFGLAMLIVTVVGLIFARRLARRVGRLSQATRRVALGELDVVVPTRSRDEIGQLSVAFNNMVAELRRNRAQIAYLQKISAWQEVARRLAHEIKNPLTPILLAMQEVHKKYSGDDPRYQKLLDDAAEIVNEEVDGLRRLVEAFSAFAKLPSVQPEDVDIADLLDDFTRTRGALEEQGEVVCEAPSPGFKVRVDRLLFRRVLVNLVENAFQAAAEQGKAPRVEIRVRHLARAGVGLITVTDNGPGIPDSLRERIFDPYFTTKSAGTGLGLAIVKKIILEHQGSVDVEAAPGGGAKFTLRVPAE
ncbi:MAG: ATP-binding protein [Polyangia bacterium]|jgi:nitrogen fixation/metabolism regulation signal transduction histidine kinase|nr:ATP-binding protein [Polyangia bacterium]